MPENRYELVLLGPGISAHRNALETKIAELFTKIGLDFAADGQLLIGGGTDPDWSGFPVAIWFGQNGAAEASDLALMRQFLDKGFTLFPVVDDLASYTKLVPPELE